MSDDPQNPSTDGSTPPLPRGSSLASRIREALLDIAAEKRALADRWRLVPQIGHGSPVRSLAAPPDGRRLVTASLDGKARLWDLETGEEIAQLASYEDGWMTAFSDGRGGLRRKYPHAEVQGLRDQSAAQVQNSRLMTLRPKD